MDLWFDGSLVRWIFGLMDLWFRWFDGSMDCGSMDSWFDGSMVRWMAGWFDVGYFRKTYLRQFESADHKF